MVLIESSGLLACPRGGRRGGVKQRGKTDFDEGVEQQEQAKAS